MEYATGQALPWACFDTYPYELPVNRDTALAAAAFRGIRTGEAAGAVALAELCEERGRRDLARVLEEWCEPWRVSVYGER
jgi:hypothetical protein